MLREKLDALNELAHGALPQKGEQAVATIKQQEFAALDSAYQEFRSVVDELDEKHFQEKWLDGRWGVREIVAHLTGWHREFAVGLERMGRGKRPAPEGSDWNAIQRWNDRFAAEAAGKGRAELLQELDRSVAHFKAMGETLPEERFGDGKTASVFFRNAGSEHFREHAAMIRTWLSKQSP